MTTDAICISDLICELEAAIEAHGDLPVLVGELAVLPAPEFDGKALRLRIEAQAVIADAATCLLYDKDAWEAEKQDEGLS